MSSHLLIRWECLLLQLQQQCYVFNRRSDSLTTARPSSNYLLYNSVYLSFINECCWFIGLFRLLNAIHVSDVYIQPSLHLHGFTQVISKSRFERKQIDRDIFSCNDPLSNRVFNNAILLSKCNMIVRHRLNSKSAFIQFNSFLPGCWDRARYDKKLKVHEDQTIHVQ